MFTGIVEELGEVAAVEELPDAARLTVRASVVGGDVGLGDSISVNGVCLTVTGWDDEPDAAKRLHFDVMAESLQPLQPGRAARRVIRSTSSARSRPRPGSAATWCKAMSTPSAPSPPASPPSTGTSSGSPRPTSVTRYLVEKGSVTVDGVSLTVTEVDDAGFAVSLIPETLRRTTLGRRAVGATVNLEVDVIAKYVESAVARLLPGGATVTP